MDEVAARAKIAFVKQAGHKPNHNALDQAVWHVLATAVRKRAPEYVKVETKESLLNHLWRVVEAEFWAMDPEIIDDCFRSVRQAAKETIEAKGWTTGKQKHAGVRKAKADFPKTKGWSRIPHNRTIHLYLQIKDLDD